MDNLEKTDTLQTTIGLDNKIPVEVQFPDNNFKRKIREILLAEAEQAIIRFKRKEESQIYNSSQWKLVRIYIHNQYFEKTDQRYRREARLYEPCNTIFAKIYETDIGYEYIEPTQYILEKDNNSYYIRKDDGNYG